MYVVGHWPEKVTMTASSSDDGQALVRIGEISKCKEGIAGTCLLLSIRTRSCLVDRRAKEKGCDICTPYGRCKQPCAANVDSISLSEK